MSTKFYHPTISLINARSVKANLIFILDFINEFNHDIIALTETWFNENECAVISSLKSTDYNFIQANHVCGRTGGGVGILCKKVLNLSIQDYLTYLIVNV